MTITAEDENSSDSEGCGLVVEHVLSAGPNTQDQWILDSGATCHMCNNESIFTDLQPLPAPLNVMLGDGQNLQAVGCGKVNLTMNLQQDKKKTCTLHEVLLVPDLAYNLLSITSVSKRGKVTTFTEMRCEIRDFKSKLIASGHRDGSLYYLDQGGPVHHACASSDHKSSKETIWHRRFGHLGAQGMQALMKNKMVSEMDFEWKQESDFCESCVEGKSHRLPFQQSTGKRMDSPLELIHSDVCGKIGTKSLGGGEYFVTFIDDHTRHVWVYILKYKNEVFKRFQEWKALVEKSSGRHIKALRSDNGGEYTSSDFDSYLTKEGIKHERTTPYTPEQNGVAERLNRTLIEGVRTILVDSKLPHRFWAEALSTIVYLRNRSPTKALEGITPHEAWSGTKPDVCALRVFGCSAYAHVPKAERGKIDSKTRKCVLLGYGTDQKGYRLYDFGRMKVIHSRDVFDEESMPGIPKEDKPFTKYVELEFEEESVVEETATTNSPSSVPEVITVNEQLGEDSTTTNPTVPQSGLRRSTRNKQKPDWYSHNLTLLSTEQQDPSSITEAESSSDKTKWRKAMEMEMESLRSNEAWELVEPPPNRRVIGSKWVFK